MLRLAALPGPGALGVSDGGPCQHIKSYCSIVLSTAMRPLVLKLVNSIALLHCIAFCSVGFIIAGMTAYFYTPQYAGPQKWSKNGVGQGFFPPMYPECNLPEIDFVPPSVQKTA